MARPARRRREARRLKGPARPKRARQRLRSLGIGAAVAIAAAVVVGLIVWSQAPWESDEETSSPIITPTPRPAETPRQGTTLGSADAPLTIVEYSDFQCPYCRQAALEIVPQVEEAYLATGKAKLVWKHFPIEGQASVWAAEAGECAAAQNAFWEYHDLLFLNQGQVAFSVENLKRFARELGLDTNAFDACLDEGKYRDKVAADAAEARRRGLTGTPTFFIGSTQLVGAKSYSEFKKAIDDELAKLGGTGESGEAE